MTARELRIGNWYNWRGGDAPDEGYNEQLLLNDYAELEKKPQRFRPIPLTEEWLLKFGFRSDGGDLFEKSDIALFFSLDKFYKLDGFDLSVKYVHQLQNLYFALIGKEL